MHDDGLDGMGAPRESVGDASEAPATPSRRTTLSRILDWLAVVIIAFAIWKLVIAPRIFAGKATSVAAPSVVLPLMNGGTFEIAKARGHVVFLDFWASWCEPCKLSIPLIEHYKTVHPDALVVSVDAGEPDALASRFAREKKMKRVAFDSDLTVTHAFGVDVFPTMIVIDRDGKERAKWIGFNPLIEESMAHAAATF
jgi:thiol-disulfide isomerase/thioredoxin